MGNSLKKVGNHCSNRGYNIVLFTDCVRIKLRAMDKSRVEDFVINLELMKKSRFYHIFNPDGSKIFNCNAYRLLLFLYGSIVNCIVVYSALGFFVEMDDALSYTDFFVVIFVMTNFFLCYWRICVFLYNVNAIRDVLGVSRFDFLKSKRCCKDSNVLDDYRDRTIKITNYFFVFSSTVMSQWILFPLVVVAFTTPEDENGRFQNIMNLRYPVSTYTYNRYYFIFYSMEVMVAIFTMYAMIMPDILLMSMCWAIIAQQEVLTRAFENIGHEDNSQTGKIFFFNSKTFIEKTSTTKCIIIVIIICIFLTLHLYRMGTCSAKNMMFFFFNSRHSLYNFTGDYLLHTYIARCNFYYFFIRRRNYLFLIFILF